MIGCRNRRRPERRNEQYGQHGHLAVAGRRSRRATVAVWRRNAIEHDAVAIGHGGRLGTPEPEGRARGGGHPAPAAARSRLLRVDGAHRRDAGLVLGLVPAHGPLVPGLPQVRPPPAQPRRPAGLGRPAAPAAAAAAVQQLVQGAPARLASHDGRAQVPHCFSRCIKTRLNN